MHKLSGCPVIVFDRDHVVAVAGVTRKEFAERRVSHMLEDLMESRSNFFSDGKEKFFSVEGIDRSAVCCVPVISASDVSGAVAFLETSSNTSATEIQKSLITASAQFLGKQIES